METEVIGREAELERIERWLEGPRPSMLLIEGEAGIGKTTLWRAAVAGAERRGARLLTCALAESEARLAFAGLSDLVRPHLGHAVSALAPPQARALEAALLLRDATEGLPDERAVAFGFLGLLAELSRQGPVVIAVDDLQWLDASSIAVLRFSARRLSSEPVGLLVARRVEAGSDGHPLEVALALDNVELIKVDSLTLGALHRLLRVRRGRPLTRPLLSRVHTASNGNPLHAIELTRALDQAAVGERRSLPGLLRARVLALPLESRRGLALAAASSDLSTSTLSRALGTDIVRQLEAAVEAELVTIEAGRVRFTHPLVASVAEDTVGEDGVQLLHRALAETSVSAEDRARHLGRATTMPDRDVAQALEDAARDVRRRGARSVAAELFEAAARLTPGGADGDRGRRALAAAWVTFEAGDSQRAEEVLTRLVDDLPEQNARCEARWRLGTVLDETGRWRAAMALWTDALAATDDPSLQAEIGRAMAITTIYTGTAEDAARFADDAVVAAERSGDRRQLAYALAARAFIAVTSGDEEYRPTIERALALEGGAEGGFGEWSPTAVAAECARHTGDIEGSRSYYAYVLDRAVEQGDANVEQWAAFGLAQGDLLAGELGRADRLADMVVEFAEQTDVMRIPSLTLRANVDAHLGRVAAARKLLAPAMELASAEDEAAHLYNACVVSGFVSVCENDVTEAAAHYGRARELAADLGLGHATAMRAFLYEAEAAAAAGLLEQADQALAAFDRAAGSRPIAWATVIHGRAVGARRAAIGELSEAGTLLDHALEADEGIMRIERGRTLLLLGTVRRRAREHSAARTALDRALAIFEAVGATPFSTRVRLELARIPGRRTTDPKLLTDAERRIAELVATGRSNKEVAAALVLSVKTIEVTLTRVYRKLGVRSRAELARGWDGPTEEPTKQ
ncbi:MAG: AAA family ATPase [Gaiellaceae bacterium MAG52_C11]|nr:AAA family ATPase [Candidatus Gaiellasilicea maunaloa]